MSSLSYNVTPHTRDAYGKRRDALNMLSHLRSALWSAKQAGATQTAKRIRLAISSAKGAVRNADYKIARAESEARHAS